jgi:hypothetical protein
MMIIENKGRVQHLEGRCYAGDIEADAADPKLFHSIGGVDVNLSSDQCITAGNLRYGPDGKHL